MNMIGTILIVTIPPALGLILVSFKQHLVAKFKRILKLFTFFVVLITFSVGVYANFYIFSLMRWYMLLCGLLLPWTGYLIGYLVAYCLKQEHKDCLTIAIETGMQNFSKCT